MVSCYWLLQGGLTVHLSVIIIFFYGNDIFTCNFRKTVLQAKLKKHD